MTNNYWDAVLKEEYEKNYFKNIAMFINKEYKEKIVYPPKRDILRALKLTDYNDVKVVILGQDPYHGANFAHGEPAPAIVADALFSDRQRDGRFR